MQKRRTFARTYGAIVAKSPTNARGEAVVGGLHAPMSWRDIVEAIQVTSLTGAASAARGSRVLIISRSTAAFTRAVLQPPPQLLKEHLRILTEPEDCFKYVIPKLKSYTQIVIDPKIARARN